MRMKVLYERVAGIECTRTRQVARSADMELREWLTSSAVITGGDAPRDVSRLVVPLRGSLVATGDVFESHRLVDAGGTIVGAAGAFLRELAAAGRTAATQRFYAYDLLRWLRPVGG